MSVKPVLKRVWVAVTAILMLGFVLAGDAHKAGAAQTPGQTWLAAMDTDHDGTVSKEEFNKYMDAQFDKADADHDGTLDAKELGNLRTMLGVK